MNKIIELKFLRQLFVWVGLMLSISGYAQINLYYGLDSTEVPGTVYFNDGHSEEGIVAGLVDRRYMFVDMKNPFKTIERNLDLMDNSFIFTNEQGEKRKIKSDEVKKVIKKYDEGYSVYIRHNLKTVNTKGKIVDLDRQAWLPLMIDDPRIKIFGLSAYDVKSRQYVGTYVYLNREGEDFVINPLDFNRLNLFNMGSVNDKMRVALKETFRDCPATIDLIDQTITNKSQKKDYKATQKKLLVGLKEIRKSNLSRDEKKLKEIQLYEEMMVSIYSNLLDHYNENCPE